MTHRSRLLGTFLAVVIMVASALLGFGMVAAPSGAGSHDGNASSGLGTATCTYPTVTDVETAASATYSSTPLTVVFYPVTPGDVFVVSAESQYSVTFTLSDAVDFFTLDTQVAIGWTNWYTWNATTSQTGYVTLTLTPSGSTSAAMIAWDVTPLGPVSVSVGAVGQGGASASSSASSGSCGLALGDWAVLNAAAGYVTSPSGWSSGSSSATTSAGDSIGGNWTYVGAGGTVTFDPTFSYTALHYNYAQVVTLAGPAPRSRRPSPRSRCPIQKSTSYGTNPRP
jgi:hypothetical protein